MDETALRFGDLELWPRQRLLSRAGQPVPLGSRPLDILLALAERPGEILSKADLIARVWPDTFVDEANLRVNMAVLRKALGDGAARIIVTVTGRGYCLAAPLQTELVERPADAAPDRPAPVAGLPLPLGRVVGREALVADILREMPKRRLITLVGPGGIGKTTVAVIVAASLAPAYRDGVVFVDLAAVTHPTMAAAAVASALGRPVGADTGLAELADLLSRRRILLVLDNCEHVVEAAATLAEAVLRAGPEVDILATSREPLRAGGEWVQRLPPLALPPQGALSAADAMTSPAVQLFVDRAAACLGGYVLDDGDAPVVTELCRRLDGVALAIELAAGHVDTIGVRGLCESVEGSFAVLTRGRRTALPRQQTLRATFDWSYGLLAADAQRLLRRLAIFNGPFTLAAATAVAAERQEASEIPVGVADLAAKSLVTAETSGGLVRYRLLGATRAYCFEKLAADGELSAAARRHARYCQTLFESAEAEWETRPANEWLEAYAPQIGNLRAALDWAFSPQGDPAIGVALTAAAVPLWFQLSLLDECLSRVQQALAELDRGVRADGRRRMQLQAALGFPRLHAMSSLPSGAVAWNATLALAEELDDGDYQLRALWALWVDRTNGGEPREALGIADRYCALADAASEPADRRIGDRMRARSLYLLGDLGGARTHVERMLDTYVPPLRRSHLARFQYDQRVTARITLTRVLWLQGFPEQALRLGSSNIEQALALNHTPTLTHALADGAAPVALMAGDFGAARRFTALLVQRTEDHALDVWRAYARCYEGELAIEAGDADAGVVQLRAAIAELRDAGFTLYQTAFLGALANGLLRLGRPVDAMSALDEALAQCERTGEAWRLAELQRQRGEVLLNQGDVVAAEMALQAALALARSQGAVAWELRAAETLASLRADQGRQGEALTLIAPIHARFTEGFDLPDLRQSATLIARLSLG
ncbi:MAG: winged helix-turn-helix domain-containing protein [Caulobacteraceae bacterium]